MATSPAGAAGDLWIFGYGSLMWRPGFDFIDRQPALLRGFHRALCVWSHDHRGTPETPGLVLGLDRGGACRGIAYRVRAEKVAATRAYLDEREQNGLVYRARLSQVALPDARRVSALAYVVDRTHPLYAGAMTREEQLAHILRGVGQSGANPDDLVSTHAHLLEMGVRDELLDWLARQLARRGSASDMRRDPP